MDEDYEPTNSVAVDAGISYEWKMTALVALRLFARFDEFSVAKEFKPARCFDDVVFTYKKDDADGRWETFFVQLKHTYGTKELSLHDFQAKDTPKKKHPFAMKKYRDSYGAIFQQFTLESTNPIFCRSLEDARFVIFTTARLNADLSGRVLKTVECPILSTGGENASNVSFDPNGDHDIIGDADDGFYDKFWFFSGHETEDHLDEIIESDMREILEKRNNSLNWSPSDLQMARTKFCTEISKGFSGIRFRFLTQDKVKDILDGIFVEAKKLSLTAVKFTDSLCLKYQNILNENRVIGLQAVADNSMVTKALLRQLNRFDFEMNLQDLNNQQFYTNYLQHILASRSTLVVDCDSNVRVNTAELKKNVTDLQTEQPNLRIIFLTVKNNTDAVQLLKELKIKQRKFNLTLGDLTVESREKLLSSQIIFQGQKTRLDELASVNFDCAINLAIMTQLLSGQEVKIGKSISNKKSFYVPRMLTQGDTAVKVSDVMEMNEKAVAVVAEPGMGKTMFLTHLAESTKKKHPEMWVVLLAFNDFSESFAAKESARTLLAKAADADKSSPLLAQRIFEQYYTFGKMEVLLDGFDEIMPHYEEQALAVIRELTNSAVKRIWVTSRTAFPAVPGFDSYSIKPFGIKEHQNFLKEFIRDRNKIKQDLEISGQVSDKYVNDILSAVANTFGEDFVQHLRTPVHTKILADVLKYGETPKSFADKLVIMKNINGLKLVEEFVKYSRQIQMDKVKFSAPNIASLKDDLNMLNQVRDIRCMELAVKTLFPSVLTSVSTMAEWGTEKNGYIVTFEGERPQFTHPIFADYFAALFFAKNLKQVEPLVASNEFFAPQFKFVRYFFDRILAADSLWHLAVLYRYPKAVKEHIQPILKGDLAFRTVFHVAAAVPGNVRVLDILFTALGDFLSVVDHFGLTAWDYAIRSQDVENIAFVYDKQQKPSPNPLFPPGFEIPITWQTLRVAVREDYLNFFRYLLNAGIHRIEDLRHLSEQEWLDPEDGVQRKMSILHLAASYNAYEILRYLLDSANCKSYTARNRILQMRNDRHKTAIDIAVEYENYEALDVLLAAGSPKDRTNFFRQRAVTPKLAQIAFNAINRDNITSQQPWPQWPKPNIQITLEFSFVAGQNK